MPVRKLIYWRFIVILFVALSSCSDKQNNTFQLQAVSQVNLEEQTHVFNYLPTQTALINDSLIVLLSQGDICIYNIYTGKLHAISGTISLNKDSLLRQTISKARLDSIELLPITEVSGDGLMKSRYHGFAVMDGELLLLYVAEYKYKPLTAAGKQAILDRMDEKIRKEITAQGIDIMGAGTAAFLIKVNDKMQVRSIIPVEFDNLPYTRHGQYHAMPNFGFYLHKGKLFTRIFDQESALMLAPPQRVKSSDSLPLIGMMDFSGDAIRWDRELINTSAISGYSFPSRYYGFSPLTFRTINDSLLLSCEAGLFVLPGGQKFRLQKKLSPGEVSFGDFEVYKERLLYTCGKESKQGYLMPDSLHFRIYNQQTGDIEYDQPFETSSFVRKGDTILAIEKNAEHFYITRYAILEK